MSWTDERIDQLKAMWERGLTASQIAEELGGVSRNAVIGKAHRLGLQSRPSPVKANETPKRAAAPTRKHSDPLDARRHASVATDRASVTWRRRSLSAQTERAAMARSIAASLIRPDDANPSPSRTMREKASTTMNPSADGLAISSRQLLVPRSMAA
ncbi:hypothetical protein RLDS_02950 [Sphingobium lactosutens DS20]|uniref:GcrA cell cycle regulator n=1 Tax=Sphingobium lactosutens DS20 TaxID=1331060 RepID=T0J8A9_9SPHN|nr:hypothetical protein RLDS_02950 [Sphingobium lactosutens DS20]